MHIRTLAGAAASRWVKEQKGVDACVPSLLGPITLTAQDGKITALNWGIGPDLSATHPAVLHLAAEQLAAYFAGHRKAFELPLALGPNPFQVAVQEAMIAIPFGETRTYGDLAKALDRPPQAIGQACGANRIPIIVPCHRVLGATNLGGFSGRGGIEGKVTLLRHEGAAGLLL